MAAVDDIADADVADPLGCAAAVAVAELTGADDAVGAGGAVGAAAAAEVVADVLAVELAEKLPGTLGRGGGFAAGGAAAAGAGRAGGTVGIAGFEKGLLVADGRAAVLEAVGDRVGLAAGVLDPAGVVCVADVGGCPVPEGAPGETGFEDAVDLVVDAVAVEPAERVSDRAPRELGCAEPDEPAALATWAVVPDLPEMAA